MCSSDNDCKEGKCLSDQSHYDGNNGCVCNKNLGFYNIQNNYSYVGYNCKNLCADNPCGNRGTCYVDSEEIKSATGPSKYINTQKCKDCKFPFIQENTNQCRGFTPVDCKTQYCTNIGGVYTCF
jgi:hypothetical protein